MNDRFVLVRPLQQRPYTRLEEVEDTRTGRLCICKRTKLDADPRILHQSRMEVEVLSTACHPALPALLDVYEQNGELVFVETRLEGQPLSEWLAQKPDTGTRHKIVQELLDIAQAIHAAGFLYLDWKPEHVWIENGRVRLLDFNGCVRTGASEVWLATNRRAIDARRQSLSESDDLFLLCELTEPLLAPPVLRDLHAGLQKIKKQREVLSVSRIRGLLRLHTLRRAALISGLSLVLPVCLLIYWPAAAPLKHPFLESGDPAQLEAELQLLEKASQPPGHIFYLAEEAGLLNETLFTRDQTARRLAQEALASQSPALCACVLRLWKQAPAHPELALKLCALAGPQSQAEDILPQILGELGGAWSEAAFCSLLGQALERECILDSRVLGELLPRLEDEKTIQLYLNYALFVLDRSGTILPVDETWQEEPARAFRRLLTIQKEETHAAKSAPAAPAAESVPGKAAY